MYVYVTYCALQTVACIRFLVLLVCKVKRKVLMMMMMLVLVVLVVGLAG